MKTNDEWAKDAHDRMKGWGFHTVLSGIGETREEREAFEGWLRDQPEFNASYVYPNTSRGVWKRLSRGDQVVYGTRAGYIPLITKFISRAMTGEDVEVAAIKTEGATYPNPDPNMPGQYFSFEVEKQRMTKPPVHDVMEMADWMANRSGLYLICWYPDEILRMSKFVFYCIGEDARFEFKLRWNV